MRYYDQSKLDAVYKHWASRYSTFEGALKLYLALGKLLYRRDAYDPESKEFFDLPEGMNRQTLLYLRRAIEQKWPEVRPEEARIRRRATNAVINDIFVQRIPGYAGGTILIPAFDSRWTRRIPFANKEHFQDIIAAMVVTGQVDPMELTVNTGSSAMPYLRFMAQY